MHFIIYHDNYPFSLCFVIVKLCLIILDIYSYNPPLIHSNIITCRLRGGSPSPVKASVASSMASRRGVALSPKNAREMDVLDRGHYITNPNNPLLQGKSLRITYTCIVWSRPKWVMQWPLLHPLYLCKITKLIKPARLNNKTFVCNEWAWVWSACM